MSKSAPRGGGGRVVVTANKFSECRPPLKEYITAAYLEIGYAFVRC